MALQKGAYSHLYPRESLLFLQTMSEGKIGTWDCLLGLWLARVHPMVDLHLPIRKLDRLLELSHPLVARLERRRPFL
jgi:hypothetical protein